MPSAGASRIGSVGRSGCTASLSWCSSVVVVLTPVTFRLLHEVYRGAFNSLEQSPGLLALVRFALALVALGPATILMGATLPTLTRYLSRRADHLSEAFGQLYAANTLGAIAGTILAGFILIELLGLTGTLLVGAACSALAGMVAIVLDERTVATTGQLATEPPSPPASVSTRPAASIGRVCGRRRSGWASWWPPCRG